MNKFRDLKIWNEAVDLAVEIYKITGEFPTNEKYGLTSQMNRSVVSISSNIADGSGRNSRKEFMHFLGIANGSSCELFSQTEIASRIGFINEEAHNETQNRLNYIQKMNYRLQQSILKTINK